MPQLFSLDTIAKKRVEKKGKLLNFIHIPQVFFFWKISAGAIAPTCYDVAQPLPALD